MSADTERDRPVLILTGASGFIGRRFLDLLKDRFVVHAIARRSQARSGAPVHRNIRWYQVDIGDVPALERAFTRIRAEGGRHVVYHLAAHYDFTGENHPEYWRTNVDGLRNVLDACRDLGTVERLVFSSSVAACSFPEPGESLDETSPADGEHVYAVTKRLGEEMVREYAEHYPSTIVRFSALFSDWCEYPPLYVFLSTWLSEAWNARMLGGRGASAIPFLHVRDATRFLRRLLDRFDVLEPGEVLVCGSDGCTSHSELYDVATQFWFGETRPSRAVPRPLCGPGMLARYWTGKMLGEPPFERPWMARYVDLALRIDSSYTRRKIDWEPRARLEILRRIPFLLENLRVYPNEWHRRNRAALKRVQPRPNLKISNLLEAHEDAIAEALTLSIRSGVSSGRFANYRAIDGDELRRHHRTVLRQLITTIRTNEREVFRSYCRDLAERRREQGFEVEEVCAAMQELDRICIETLTADAAAADVRDRLSNCVTMTLRFGCDQIEETFETEVERR